MQIQQKWNVKLYQTMKADMGGMGIVPHTHTHTHTQNHAAESRWMANCRFPADLPRGKRSGNLLKGAEYISRVLALF
jgi:hypothetical protein